MRTFFKDLEKTLADAALLEMGVELYPPDARTAIEHETLEENLIEVAFAEAADYEDIHQSIQREHCRAWLVAHPDDRGTVCTV